LENSLAELKMFSLSFRTGHSALLKVNFALNPFFALSAVFFHRHLRALIHGDFPVLTSNNKAVPVGSMPHSFCMLCSKAVCVCWSILFACADFSSCCCWMVSRFWMNAGVSFVWIRSFPSELMKATSYPVLLYLGDKNAHWLLSF
jgi:hypothetical protein